MKPTKTIVFDLDDTLVPEIEYLESAFREIARFVDSGRTNLFEEMMENYRRKENVFGKLIEQYPQLTLDELKRRYRYHVPDFSAYGHIRDLLTRCKESGYLLGLITDGYAVTQRNKIHSLGIESLLDLIVISEEFGSENRQKIIIQFFTALERINIIISAIIPTKILSLPINWAGRPFASWIRAVTFTGNSSAWRLNTSLN
ncbi:MAG: HAD hydrolase-like protein [Ferruginibacter sp.]